MIAGIVQNKLLDKHRICEDDNIRQANRQVVYRLAGCKCLVTHSSQDPIKGLFLTGSDIVQYLDTILSITRAQASLYRSSETGHWPVKSGWSLTHKDRMKYVS